MKKQSYFDRNPIKRMEIAKDCEHIFLPTEEKKERWQKIINKTTDIVQSLSIKSFVQFLN